MLYVYHVGTGFHLLRLEELHVGALKDNLAHRRIAKISRAVKLGLLSFLFIWRLMLGQGLCVSSSQIHSDGDILTENDD